MLTYFPDTSIQTAFRMRGGWKKKPEKRGAVVGIGVKC